MTHTKKREQQQPPNTYQLLFKTIMLEANSETASPISGALWFPGKKMEGIVVAPLSARALEIAKSREELLRLLHDLPESEYELSLTDLVEKGSVAGNPGKKDTSFHEREPSKAATVNKERKKKKKRSSSSSRSSFGSSGGSDGVLLNFYMPASLSRSLTTPRSAGHQPMPTAPTNCNKRDRELKTSGCWSVLWLRGKGKSRKEKPERMS